MYKRKKTEPHVCRITDVMNHRFTLIELLVVIAVIALLASLLLPVLQSSMNTVKRVQCMNTVRFVHQVYGNYLEDNHAYLPSPAGYPTYGRDVVRALLGPYPIAGAADVQAALFRYYVDPKGKTYTSWDNDWYLNEWQRNFLKKFACPQAVALKEWSLTNGTTTGSYAQNGCATEKNLYREASPSRMILLFDWQGIIQGDVGGSSMFLPGSSKNIAQRHKCSLNADFLDGHTESFTFKRFPHTGNPWYGGPTGNDEYKKFWCKN